MILVPPIEPMLAKLSEALAQPLAIDGHDLAVRASVGVARFPEDGADFDTLLQKADTALYRAKDAGRSTWRFFDEQMNQHMRERVLLQAGLRQALEAGQLLLHYQPQVALRSGAPVGVEALLRWNRPGEGLVMPGVFIPVAEESDLILQLGKWVFEEVARQLREWIDEGLPVVPVAINVSARQCLGNGLVELVASTIANYHQPLYYAGGALMLALAVLSLSGRMVSLPSFLRAPDTSRGDSASFFALGVFSGIASSCCAPVLAGGMTLSALSGSPAGGVLLGLAYTFGMVFPLFVMALVWDRFRLGERRFLRAKPVRIRVAGRVLATNTMHRE